MGQAMPRGLHTATPSLVLGDCSAAITFYQRVFGALPVADLRSPDGKQVLHAELRLGDSTIYLSDEVPGSPARAPSAEHPSHLAIQLYLPDAEAAYGRALAAGARASSPLSEGPYGDRVGVVCDPFGVVWVIARHVHHVRLDDERDAQREAAEPSGLPA